MPYQYPTSTFTANAALSYGPTYSAASPEILNSDQTPPLTDMAALLTALLTLLLLLNVLTMTQQPQLFYLRSYLLYCIQ